MAQPVRDRGYRAHDGLWLHFRDYRPVRGGDKTPVLCLPGVNGGVKSGHWAAEK